jgi:signal transduction histidine kinase
VLTVTVMIVSILQQVYITTERTRSVDQRLETLASSLIASGLSLDLIENLDSTDDLISELLGEERADMIIVVYSLDGEVLAENSTAEALPLQFFPTPGHQQYKVAGKTIRSLNLLDQRLVIQVGVVLDSTLNWTQLFFNRRFAVLFLAVALLLLASSYAGSRILFAPLRRLTKDFETMSAQLGHKLGKPLSEFVIGSEFSQFTKRRFGRDEFVQLCEQIENFLEKLTGYTATFHAQTAVLTHELKTPLTVLRNSLEELSRTNESPEAIALRKTALSDLDRLTALINDYLQWSVLSSNPEQPNEVYAIKLADVVRNTASALNSVNGNRIDLTLEDATVFALPFHVEQLVSNLLSNALRYSPTNTKVLCEVIDGKLVVNDSGPGVPAAVLKNLGRPFNRGTNQNLTEKGSGLGLAWVQALCEKYGWKLSIDSTDTGTKVSVLFT